MRFRILLLAVLLVCSANLLAQTCNPMAGDPCPGWAKATPSTGIVPLTVSFDTSPGSPGDVIPLFSLQFDHWDFGDGQTSTESQPTHTYTAPGRYIATAIFKEISNFSMGLMCGEDGGNCGTTFQTFTANITVLQTVTSLSLTPSVATMLTGDSRTLSLQDNNGTPIVGAIWAVDQSSVISLSADDPPILTANSAGTAIITASSGNLSSHATIQVVDPGNTTSLPAGTVVWSMPPLPGFVANRVLQVTPSEGKASLVGIESDQNSNMVLRGLTDDGRQMWQTPINHFITPSGSQLNLCCVTVPDSSGGTITIAENTGTQFNSFQDSLIRLDGTDGSLTWRYDSAGIIGSDPRSGLGASFGGFAVGSAIYAVETVHDAPGIIGSQNQPNGSAHSYLIALDGATGTVLQRVPLPTGHQLESGSNGVADDYDTGAVPGHVSIMPDASVAVEVFTLNNQFIGAAQTISNTLRVITLRPDGSTTTTMLRQSSCSFDCIEFYGPGEIAPDGHDGLLATWRLFGTGFSGVPESGYVTHIDALGTFNNVLMPFFDAGQIVLGENDQAFISDFFKLVAFDVNTDIVQWSWQPPQDKTVSLVAALKDGGVSAKQKDGNTLQEQIIRFDSNANITFDPNLNTIDTQYSWKRQWYGIGQTTGQVEAIANNVADLAVSTWAFAGGTPFGNWKAGRPWFFKLIFQNDFTFTPGYPNLLPNLKTDITSKAPIIKAAAIEAVQDAYRGFPVNVSEGTPKTGDHRATVLNHQNISPNTPDCGVTDPTQVTQTESQVDYLNLMDTAQRVLKISITNAADEAHVLAQPDIFRRIGRGIGTVAAHEIAHQFLFLCCNMDADTDEDPNAKVAYNAAFVCGFPEAYNSYSASTGVRIHWEAPRPFQDLDKCLNPNWQDWGALPCHKP